MPPGLLTGLADPQLSRTLTALHEAPGEPWSLAQMAQQAGMSRSAFAARFKAVVGDTPADWPEKGMDRLHALGFKTAAMALDARAVSIDDPALQAEEKLAIVLGTEGDGLAHSTIARCDYTVMIPMQHGVDSLNVAAAGAVAFWELRKR